MPSSTSTSCSPIDQLDGGRYFLHGRPEHATSWQWNQVKNLMEAEGVHEVGGDQCQLGAEIQRGMRKGHPATKPTGLLTPREWPRHST